MILAAKVITFVSTIPILTFSRAITIGLPMDTLVNTIATPGAMELYYRVTSWVPPPTTIYSTGYNFI